MINKLLCWWLGHVPDMNSTRWFYDWIIDRKNAQCDTTEERQEAKCKRCFRYVEVKDE